MAWLIPSAVGIPLIVRAIIRYRNFVGENNGACAESQYRWKV